MPYIRTLIIAALIAAFFTACSANRGRAVAEVNGTTIYTADVANAMLQERSKYDDVLARMPNTSRQLAATTLEMLIQERILLDEARRLGITASDDEMDAYLESLFDTSKRSKIEDLLTESGLDPDFWLYMQRNKLIVKKLVDREVIEQIPVTENEISEYYKSHEEDFHLPLQYHARQILVDSRAKADDIAKRIKDGEEFAELARKYSISPDAERGGDLGFFSTMEFPKIFSEFCASLKPGDISGVKETDYGYQIFQLLEKRRPRTQTLDSVRPVIIDRIRGERSADAFVKWFTQLRAKSNVAIHDDALQEVHNYGTLTKK